MFLLCCCASCFLTLLFTDNLSFVTNTLALVWLWLLESAYRCGELSNEVFVSSENGAVLYFWKSRKRGRSAGEEPVRRFWAPTGYVSTRP
jgi:hypothetical protein